MKITLTKHGGWTAGMRSAPRCIDLSSLPKEAVDEFKKLISAAKGAAAQTKAERRPGGDAMSYTITIEDSPTPTVLKQSDTNMSDAFADLLDRIEET